MLTLYRKRELFHSTPTGGDPTTMPNSQLDTNSVVPGTGSSAMIFAFGANIVNYYITLLLYAGPKYLRTIWQSNSALSLVPLPPPIHGGLSEGKSERQLTL